MRVNICRHISTYLKAEVEKRTSLMKVFVRCVIFFPGIMSSISNKQKPFVVSFDMIFVGDGIQVFLDGEADRGLPPMDLWVRGTGVFAYVFILYRVSENF